MAEIVVDLGPVNAVDETAFERAIERLVHWHETRVVTVRRDRDAPDLMTKITCDPAGELRKAVIFQKEEWASVFMSYWNSAR